MKNKILTAALLAAALFPQAMAQENEGAESKPDKLMEVLEKRRETLQARMEKASQKLASLDSIKRESDALKAEGIAERDAIIKDKAALESRVKGDLKETEKAIKSSDKEEAKAASERQKEINRLYREEIKELQVKFKEAEGKIMKAASMTASSFEEKREFAQWDLKEAQANLKTIEQEIEIRQNPDRKKGLFSKKK